MLVSLFPLLALLLTFSSVPFTNVAAHVAMQWPAPRGSPPAAAAGGEPIDYNIKSPGHGCGRSGPPAPTNTFAAGTTIRVQMRKDGASHNGGVCTWSLNNQVIQTDTGCPNTNNGGPHDWQVAIPPTAAIGVGVFTWTWHAKATPEVFQNCADVIVTGGHRTEIAEIDDASAAAPTETETESSTDRPNRDEFIQQLQVYKEELVQEEIDVKNRYEQFESELSEAEIEFKRLKEAEEVVQERVQDLVKRFIHHKKSKSHSRRE